MFVSWQLLCKIVTLLRSSLLIIDTRSECSFHNQLETNTLKRVGFSWLLIARENSLSDTTQQSRSEHDHSRLSVLKTKNPTCATTIDILNSRQLSILVREKRIIDLDKLREKSVKMRDAQFCFLFEDVEWLRFVD